MKVCVISGSPKGEYSITYQTVLFWEKRFKDCEFTTIHAGKMIHKYERDMSKTKEILTNADLILFCYPVYTFLAPSQLHRFIELMKESDIDFSDKYAAQVTTSKHFYDTTAHKYIEENCQDMNMKYVGGLSADMDDLLSEKGQKQALSFWNLVQYKVANDIYNKKPLRTCNQLMAYTKGLNEVSKKSGFEAVIVANLEPEDTSLRNMIEDFQAIYPYKTKLINIAEYPFSGGCLGCFNCGATGKCIYKDGFDTFLREEIQNNSSIVYAFTIKDHSMGARMKMYDDRQFCNGHRTVTMGMPFGYIVNGDLDNEPNLQMIIEGRAQVGGNYLAGVATDKQGIIDLSKQLAYAVEEKVEQPPMFLGVGGMKIFRDLIWVMQGFMKEDHRFYKEHGIYDFPQKQKGTIIKMKLVGLLLSSKKVQAKIGNKMTEGMLAPYKKVLEKDV